MSWEEDMVIEEAPKPKWGLGGVDTTGPLGFAQKAVVPEVAYDQTPDPDVEAARSAAAGFTMIGKRPEGSVTDPEANRQREIYDTAEGAGRLTMAGGLAKPALGLALGLARKGVGAVMGELVSVPRGGMRAQRGAVGPRKVMPLTPEEYNAVESYVLGPGSSNANALRTQVWEDLHPAQQNMITQLDSVVSKAPVLTKDKILYRVVGKEDFGDSLKVGDTFTDPGFLATSTNKNTVTAPGLSNPANRTMLTINVPKGTKAVDIPNAVWPESKKTMKFAEGEDETLLGRGHTFEVVKRDGDNVVLALKAQRGAVGDLKAPTLAEALSDHPYTTKTLARLPQNKDSFSREFIEQQLRQQDVTAADKGVLAEVLKDVPAGGRIGAKDLAERFKTATKDFELERAGTDQYANYGLENIGREFAAEGSSIPFRPGKDVQATTTLHRLPPHMQFSDANHFSDPRLFGWTRSFDEGGVRHVVEIQSDLAQHAKLLTPERRISMQAEYDRLRLAVNELEALEKRGEGLPENHPINQAYYAKEKELGGSVSELDLRIREMRVALKADKSVDSVQSMLKDWPKRLIREDLAASAREGKLVHRFATADTVAKVEGWPKQVKFMDVDLKTAKEQVVRAKADVENSFEGAQKNVSQERLDAAIRYQRKIENELAPPAGNNRIKGLVQQYENRLGHEAGTDEKLRAKIPGKVQQAKAAMIKAWEKGVLLTDPEHAMIYDRYADPITKYLKQQGGVKVTDPLGHTWIEVPTAKFRDASGKAKQTEMFSAGAAAPWLADPIVNEPDQYRMGDAK